MDYESFIQSMSDEAPPPGLTLYLEALWHDGNEHWEVSHTIAQDIDDRNGSWIHAYLHRKEGDNANAAYWYTKAGKAFPLVPLQEEWALLVKAFI